MRAISAHSSSRVPVSSAFILTVESTLTFPLAENDRVSEFGLKLMSIEEEQVSVPEMEYEAKVTLPSAEFQRICRDLSTIGESS